MVAVFYLIDVFLFIKLKSLRPWDPQNDLDQYESDFKIMTKTRHNLKVAPPRQNLKPLESQMIIDNIDNNYNKKRIDEDDYDDDDDEDEKQMFKSSSSKMRSSPDQNSNSSKIKEVTFSNNNNNKKALLLLCDQYAEITSRLSNIEKGVQDLNTKIMSSSHHQSSSMLAIKNNNSRKQDIFSICKRVNFSFNMFVILLAAASWTLGLLFSSVYLRN